MTPMNLASSMFPPLEQCLLITQYRNQVTGGFQRLEAWPLIPAVCHSLVWPPVGKVVLWLFFYGDRLVLQLVWMLW